MLWTMWSISLIQLHLVGSIRYGVYEFYYMKSSGDNDEEELDDAMDEDSENSEDSEDSGDSDE